MFIVCLFVWWQLRTGVTRPRIKTVDSIYFALLLRFLWVRTDQVSTGCVSVKCVLGVNIVNLYASALASSAGLGNEMRSVYV